MCDERVLCLYTFVIVCIVFESTMLCIDSTQHNLVLLFSSAAGTLKQISLTGQLYRMVCLLRELMCEVCVCGYVCVCACVMLACMMSVLFEYTVCMISVTRV